MSTDQSVSDYIVFILYLYHTDHLYSFSSESVQESNDSHRRPGIGSYGWNAKAPGE